MFTLDTQYNFKVCCFCSSEVSLDTRVCSCGDYKGLMTVEAYEEYLGVKWEE
jgi:hypothetical protein